MRCLRGLTANWSDDLKAQLSAYPDVFLIPQVGLNLGTGVADHYEAQVAGAPTIRKSRIW